MLPKSAKQEMSDYPRRMRAKGLRPTQLPVPDLLDPERMERVRALRNHPSSRDGDQSPDVALAEIEGWNA